MKPVRALVTDKRSGNLYHCTFSTTNEGFVYLKNPIKQKREMKDTTIFKEGKDKYINFIQYYGVCCRDIMIPNERIFVEILPPDATIDWIDVTEEEALKILETKIDEAKDKSDRDQQEYYRGKSQLEKFLLKLFGNL